MRLLSLVRFAALATSAAQLASGSLCAKDWPQFRGPDGQGHRSRQSHRGLALRHRILESNHTLRKRFEGAGLLAVCCTAGASAYFGGGDDPERERFNIDDVSYADDLVVELEGDVSWILARAVHLWLGRYTALRDSA